jgi:antitoxin (DNA-binding transcriptional repressor) of toxin-antitoxin stability system
LINQQETTTEIRRLAKGSFAFASNFQGFDRVASGSYHASMRSVGLKVLKNRLAEYVRLAASGETVLVTDRDQVVAELVPPRPGRSPLLADALLADAVRKGLIVPPAIVSKEPPTGYPVARLETLLDELAGDRGER